MERNELTIGLFGFGCVGYGLYQVLQETTGLKAKIKTICIKNAAKPRPISSECFTLNREAILDDPEINVVVELIDDAQAAFEIVAAALKKGKAVVSANKKMIAENFAELLYLQQRYKAPLVYEAACCASIPIIRNLEEYYDTDLLNSIEGVVNGSCNFILSKILSDNQSFSDALQQAQALGFAESNPLLDIEGHDAKYKLQILIAHAFGLVLRPEDIFTIGIQQIGELERQYAQAKGVKIKLVAHAVKGPDNAVSYFVLPKFIGPDNKLYMVDGVYNGVITHTSFSETQFFMGKGAGAYPTASAVLSDLAALTYAYKYEYKKLHQPGKPTANHRAELSIYLRAGISDLELAENYFTAIEERYSKGVTGYLVGNISLHNLKNVTALLHSSASVILNEVVEKPVNEPLYPLLSEEVPVAVWAGYSC